MTTMIAVLAVMSAAQPAAQGRALAVLPLQTRSLAADKVSILDDILVTSVAELGLYRVISASDVNAMLGLDKMKQALGCSDLSRGRDRRRLRRAERPGQRRDRFQPVGAAGAAPGRVAAEVQREHA